jgi:ribosomal protein S18 acetylase RimI-like enzyme
MASHASQRLRGVSIEYRDTHDIDLDQLTTLFDAVGWQRRTADRDRLAQLVSGSLWIISAWDGDHLVGFARAISDGAFNAYISTVAVLLDYQQRGIGRELVHRLIEGRDGIQFVLHANDRAYPFYLHLGLDFQPFDNVLMRPRKL